MVTRMRRVGKLGPAAGRRVEGVEPGDVAAHMAAAVAADQVDDPLVHRHAARAAPALRRDCGPLAPAVGRGIVDQHVRHRRLLRELAGQGADDIQLAANLHTLQMVDLEWRRFTPGPAPSGRVVYLERPLAASAEQDQAPGHRHEAVLVARHRRRWAALLAPLQRRRRDGLRRLGGATADRRGGQRDGGGAPDPASVARPGARVKRHRCVPPWAANGLQASIADLIIRQAAFNTEEHCIKPINIRKLQSRAAVPFEIVIIFSS